MDPLPSLWGFMTAMVLLAAGTAMLSKKNDRIAATLAGLIVTLLTLFIYFPLLPLATKPSGMNEATNYIADTLLFAGSILVVAGPEAPCRHAKGLRSTVRLRVTVAKAAVPGRPCLFRRPSFRQAENATALCLSVPSSVPKTSLQVPLLLAAVPSLFLAQLRQ